MTADTHEPRRVVALVGASQPGLQWSDVYVDGKGHPRECAHTLWFTVDMLPMLTAVVSALLKEQASLVTCFGEPE